MMRLAASLLVLCGVALAHTPTITPGKGKMGDFPPKLEDEPLPPFLVWSPVPGAVVVLVP